MPPATKRARRSSDSPSAAADAPLVSIEGDLSLVHTRLNEMRKAGTLTDVVVQPAEHAGFQAHRCVLAACSDYMAALFTSGMRDADDDTVRLDDMRAPILSAVLDHVYTGRCAVAETDLVPLLEAAAMLQAAALQSAVVETLKARVSADNALALWSAGERLAMPDVVKKATSTALSKFADLASSGSLLEATYEQLLALVQDDHLDVKSEDELFKAVAGWVDHYNRSQPVAPLPEPELLSLLKHIRFSRCSREFVQKNVRAWPPMQTAAGQAVLLDALVPVIDGTKSKPRRGSRLPIEWVASSYNMTIAVREDGVTTVSRTNHQLYDGTVGKHPIVVGRHCWIVTTSSRRYTFVGVANLSDGAFPRVAQCFVVGLDSGTKLGLGSHSALRFGNEVGEGITAWREAVQKTGDIYCVRVILDMDARTLSFGYNGQERLAFSDLPEAVHPYIVSGNSGEVFTVRQGVLD